MVAGFYLLLSRERVIFVGIILFLNMPKLYEYFGIIVLIYSNEHKPIHVHGKYQNRESKAEIIIEDGIITEIVISDVKGKFPYVS